MNKCAVKRGIITLRDCNNPVAGTCGQCNRPMCAEHTATGGTICVECNARNRESAEQKGFGALGDKSAKPPRSNPSKQQPDYEDDSSWPYLYRHHYYSTYHYSPFYSGAYYDSYYDSYDVRSLEAAPGEGEMGEGIGEDAGGFYDS